jgi:tRNA(Ile)-lysidine synthase
MKRLMKPLSSFQTLAIAVSGGGDSMALLRLAHAHHSKLVALTVDHGLRKEAVREAKQVERWCRAVGIEHHTLKWKHSGITSGVQAKARTARYDLMTDWCVKHGVTALLTAHTADDQAETVMMRSHRTQSDKSLAAIWPETNWNGVAVLRPLLSATRAELRNYLTSLNQEWIEDPSNSDSRFERVRIRSAAPSLALTKTASAAQRKIRVAQAEAGRWMKRYAATNVSGMITILSASLKSLPGSASDEALLDLIDRAGGTAPERAKRDALTAWLASDESGRRTLGGVLFAKRKNEIIVAREPGRIAAGSVALSPKMPIIWDKRFIVAGPKGSKIISKKHVKSLKRHETLPAFVDAGLPVITRHGEFLADPFVSHHKAAKIKLVSK